MTGSISFWIKTDGSNEMQQPYFDFEGKSRGNESLYNPLKYCSSGNPYQGMPSTGAAFDALKKVLRNNGTKSPLHHQGEMNYNSPPLATSPLNCTGSPNHRAEAFFPRGLPHLPFAAADLSYRRRSASPIDLVRSTHHSRSSSLSPDLHPTASTTTKSWEENIDELRVKLAEHFQELRHCSTMNIQRLSEASDPNGVVSPNRRFESGSCSSGSPTRSTFSGSESDSDCGSTNSKFTKVIMRTDKNSSASALSGSCDTPEPNQTTNHIGPQPPTPHPPRARGQIKEKIFKCSLCPKAFTQKCNLTKHIRVHTNEKPYKCEFCSKAFTQKAYLVPHLRTHTHEKPFQCAHCGKCFTQKHDLTKHVRIHTNVRPYKCTYCTKAFVQKSALTSHIRTHTKEKPFACTYCTKAFNQKYDLTKHIRTHTKEKSFTCDSCEKSFSRKDYFNIHQKICTKLDATSS